MADHWVVSDEKDTEDCWQVSDEMETVIFYCETKAKAKRLAKALNECAML